MNRAARGGTGSDGPGPFVPNVHAPHREHALPMIPSGMTVKDIIKE